MSLLLRAGVRELLRHPAQMLLALAGIALGVAVGVAIDLANDSARRAFRLATDAVAGSATHTVRGGSTGLDERLLVELRVDVGARAAAPVVEGWLTELPGEVRRLRLLGVDPFSEAPFRPFLAPVGAGAELGRLLTVPGALVLATETATGLGVRPGERFVARAAGRPGELELVATLTPRDPLSRAVLDGLAVADIATAQELLGRPGRIDRIDLALPEGAAGEQLLAAVRARLPPDARLEPAGARAGALERLTRAFRFNLRALSALALLCGAFLIFNTVTFSVVRRRALFARLRAGGLGSGQLLGALLGEAALLGAVGGALGIALGVALGRALVERVLDTIDDLYFALGVRSFEVEPATLVTGLALGIAASVLAALAPALEAGRVGLRDALSDSALEQRAGGLARRSALAGLVAVASGALLIAVAGRALAPALLGFLLLVVGASLQVPAALALGLRVAGGLPGLALRQAVRGVERSLARTGPAAAALALAVGMSLAVALTITSFRSAVADWLDATLLGDLYVAAPAAAAGPGAPLAPGLAAEVSSLPGVEAVRTLHALALPPLDQGPAPLLLGVETDADAFAAFRLRHGEAERARRALAAGWGALVSEPWAERRGLGLGDRLSVPGASGSGRFEIVGVHVDYGSERGAIVLSRQRLLELHPEAPLSALALRLAASADTVQLRREIAARAEPVAVEVRSNGELKRHSLALFDRTFRVTGVLRSLALVVAALGIAAALAALELERARHFALLRAIGLPRRRLAALVLGESAILGLAAGLAALPLGAALAALLVGVVQRRSFGWSFPLELPPLPFAESLALGVGAALAAGALSAWRLARRAPVEVLREE